MWAVTGGDESGSDAAAETVMRTCKRGGRRGARASVAGKWHSRLFLPSLEAGTRGTISAAEIRGRLAHQLEELIIPVGGVADSREAATSCGCCAQREGGIDGLRAAQRRREHRCRSRDGHLTPEGVTCRHGGAQSSAAHSSQHHTLLSITLFSASHSSQHLNPLRDRSTICLACASGMPPRRHIAYRDQHAAPRPACHWASMPLGQHHQWHARFMARWQLSGFREAHTESKPDCLRDWRCK